jgi:murein DD-endopeptidase MepM/ murein hydrolase activator NlpD
MSRHRTTARGILLSLLLLGLTAGPAAASGRSEAAAPAKVPRLIFPVLGESRYFADFGAPRGQGSHEGNDIMAPKRAVAVAAEAGVVKFHTTSSRAGCMLYLDGASGTEYLYIHLNNDLTLKNDNRGRCVAGVSYWRGLKSGDRVEAGEPIGYVGDSGDADGIASHLHFEVRPGGGGATDPFPHLKKAQRLLFAAVPGTTVNLTLSGSFVEAVGPSLTVKVDQLRVTTGLRVPKVGRNLELFVPPETQVFNPLGALVAAARLEALKPGQPTTVFTEAFATSLETQLGTPLTIATERVELAPAFVTQRGY